jgi:hypothetical protein
VNEKPDEPLLTVDEAYRAAYHFVSQYYARERITPLFLMLHSMALAEDGDPHDSATPDDWVSSVKAALASPDLPYPAEPLDGK